MDKLSNEQRAEYLELDHERGAVDIAEMEAVAVFLYKRMRERYGKNRN